MDKIQSRNVYLCGLSFRSEAVHDYLLKENCNVVAYCTSESYMAGTYFWSVPVWTLQRAIAHYIENDQEGVFILCDTHPLLNNELRDVLIEKVRETDIQLWSDIVGESQIRQIKNLTNKNKVLLIADPIPYIGMEDTWQAQGVSMDEVILFSPETGIEEALADIDNPEETVVMFMIRLPFDYYEEFWESLYEKLKRKGITNIHVLYSKTNYPLEQYYRKYLDGQSNIKVTKPKFSSSSDSNTQVCEKNRIEIEDVEGVLLLDSRSSSGCVFIDTIITKHSEILSTGINYLQHMLWMIVQEVKVCDTAELHRQVAAVIDAYSKRMSSDFFEGKQEAFEQELKRVIGSRKFLNEWEIFAAVYIAYHYWKGYSYHGNGKPVIYMELHRTVSLNYLLLRWLRLYFPKVSIFTNRRNPIKRLGSAFRHTCNDRKMIDKKVAFCDLPDVEDQRKSEDELIVRFEDAKEYPEQVFGKILSSVGLQWEDGMKYKKGLTELDSCAARFGIANDFELKPVYNTYDDYFSPFDKVRLEILYSMEKVLYGYDSLDWRDFGLPMEDIKKWYLQPFKIVKYFEFDSDVERELFRRKFLERCMYVLDVVEKNYDNAKLLNDVFIPKKG